MTTPLSVVIPAYNEAVRLGNTLRAVVDYLRQNSPESEVIVVDDGSSDQTAELAREAFKESGDLRTSVITYKSNLGKGRAVRLGLLAARCDVALFSDADLSTPIAEAPKLVAPIASGQCDVAFGSRALDRKLIGVHQSWRREQGGRVFNLAVRLATGMPFWDTQCGFKAFRMSACRPLVEAALSRGWKPPVKGFWSLVPDAFGLHAEPPTLIVDVQPWVRQKVAAILCHKTQMGLGHPFDQLDPVEAERWLGTEHFHRVAGGESERPALELIGDGQTRAV